MNRWEFMKALERLLLDIPIEEREEALKYYNDYFDDAGEENAESVISKLGSPQEVAAQIRKDYESSNVNPDMDNMEERGYLNTPIDNREKYSSDKQDKNKMSTGVIILIVILCILASPLLVGVAGALFGIIVAFLGIYISVVIVAAAGAFAGLVSGVVLVVGGIIKGVYSPMGAIATIGIGLISLAIGVLCLICTVLLTGVLIPLIVKATRSIVGSKKKKEAQ